MGKGCTFAVVLPLLLTACAAPRDEDVAEARSAIRDGFPDSIDAAVVGVVQRLPATHRMRTCSGTLIAPNLVLTAQHCIADTREMVDCATSVFGPPAAAELVNITTSEHMWEGDPPWVEAAELLTPPGGDTVCGRDLALIRLSEPIGSSCLPLAPDLDVPVHADEPYAAIGFGRTGDGVADAGHRRRRDGLHVVCVGEGCDTSQVATPEWRGDHGVCNGDSGGPAVDAAGRVVGVTSRGRASCERPIYGGLDGHAEWLRAEARRAAEAGGYPAPSWVDGPDEQLSNPFVACSAAPAAPRGGVAWLALAVVVSSIAVARRRAPI